MTAVLTKSDTFVYDPATPEYIGGWTVHSVDPTFATYHLYIGSNVTGSTLRAIHASFDPNLGVTNFGDLDRNRQPQDGGLIYDLVITVDFTSGPSQVILGPVDVLIHRPGGWIWHADLSQDWISVRISGLAEFSGLAVTEHVQMRFDRRFPTTPEIDADIDYVGPDL